MAKANDINVGGTLHSIATGNIIAHADEVMDESWNNGVGQKLSIINQELKDKGTELNSGIEEVLESVELEVLNRKNADTTLKQAIDNYTINGHKISSNPVLNKSDVGLNNVTNDSLVKRSEMGIAGGVATLNDSGKVPASQLPAFVDDVLEGKLISSTNFVINAGLYGEVLLSGIVYLDTTTNISYRWSGTLYVKIGSDLALGETSSTAYAGNKGKATTDKVDKVYGSNSVINGVSDVVFDTDVNETLVAANSLKSWSTTEVLNDMKIPHVTTTKAGVMSKEDKIKLNNIDTTYLKIANSGIGKLGTYSAAITAAGILPTDTISIAIGKLEKKLNDISGNSDGSILKLILDAIEALINGASDGYTTLKDIEEKLQTTLDNITPADEEDITSENGSLHFKDRVSDPDNFVGKGYKILRKNIVDGKNVLTLEMINEANTIYEIRYDFDLEGNTINIPNKCILKIEGGSLKNGKFSSTSTNFSIIGYGCLLEVKDIPSSNLSKISMPTIYVDPNTGNDNNIGNKENPFRLVNTALKYSNHVSIKRNTYVHTFEEMNLDKKAIIYINHAVTLDSYGGGELPIITGKILFDRNYAELDLNGFFHINFLNKKIALANKWNNTLSDLLTIDTNNQWILNFGFIDDNTIRKKLKHVKSRELALNYLDFYNVLESDPTIYYDLYVRDNLTYYNNRASLGVYGIYILSLNVHIKDIKITCVGRHGIANVLENSSIENCFLEHIGGSVYSIGENDFTLYGNGIEVYGSDLTLQSSLVLCRNNIISFCYNSAITTHGTYPYRVIAENNMISCTPYGIEFYNPDSENVYSTYSNNTFLQCNNKSSRWTYYVNGDPKVIKDYYGAFVCWESFGRAARINNNLIIDCPILALAINTESTPRIRGNTIIASVQTPIIKYNNIPEVESKYIILNNTVAEKDRLLALLQNSLTTNVFNTILITDSNNQWATIN